MAEESGRGNVSRADPPEERAPASPAGRTAQADPLPDEQATLEGAEGLAPNRPPGDRHWREPVQVVPEEVEEADGREWAGGEATGMSGGGMPEPAGQTEDPGTDTDLTLPKVKKRINMDRV